MKSYAFLFWAYNVVWLGLAAYLLFLFARIGKLSRRLDAVEGEIRSRRGSQESSGS